MTENNITMISNTFGHPKHVKPSPIDMIEEEKQLHFALFKLVLQRERL